MNPDTRARRWQDHRDELLTYATRLVVRQDVAEDLCQQAAVRMLEAVELLPRAEELRPWLYRVVTNLAIDHLRKHSTWRETLLVDTRDRADGDHRFVADSQLLRGSPEMKTIAREHLEVCFSCTARNLRPHEAAALLLKEVCGFTTEETAHILSVTFGQAKNHLQDARGRMSERYASTCALVSQKGACFQCVELDEFFNGTRSNPLEGTARDLDARLALLRERRSARLGPWHEKMMVLVDQVLAE
jgi:RNA polymerase sigma-70 factor (ECF subfamily)